MKQLINNISQLPLASVTAASIGCVYWYEARPMTE